MATDLDNLIDATKKLLAPINAKINALGPNDPQIPAFNEQAEALGDLLDNLDTMAVDDAIASAQQAVDQLKGATTALNGALATVQDIKDVINCAALTVSLGAAIAAGDPGKVITAGANLYNAIDKVTAKT